MVMATKPQVKEAMGNVVRLSPSIVKLMRYRGQEALLEGPARTGKSFGLCLYARTLCEWFPGVKGLFVRQTRKSLNASILTLWEDLLGKDHPVLLPRRQKRTRDDYIFPYAENTVDEVTYKGVSEIHLIGMDNPERLMSTEYDFIFVFEATELSLRAWALAFSRLSNGHLPWNFQVADCNPAAETHWLNLRADEPEMEGNQETGQNKMLRIPTNLKDNPKFWDSERKAWTPQGVAYNRKLDNLPPLERARLRDGKWVSASGQVFEAWRQDHHVVQGKLRKRQLESHHEWYLDPIRDEFGNGDFEQRTVEYFLVGVDWGFRPDPGTAALYAVDDHGRLFVVFEYYITGKALDWWAQKIVGWQKRYDVRAIICDVPEEKSRTLNDMMGHKLGMDGRPIARVAKKGTGSVASGIDILRWHLDDDEDGEPRLRYFATSPMVTDSYLVDEMVPTCGPKEYPGYVYHVRVDGKPNKDAPVDLNNHAIDRDRYVATYNWDNKHRSRKVPELVKNPGTLGAQLNMSKRIKDAFKAAQSK